MKHLSRPLNSFEAHDGHIARCEVNVLDCAPPERCALPVVRESTNVWR